MMMHTTGSSKIKDQISKREGAGMGLDSYRIFGILRLVRLPNVLIVVLTMVLLRYCILFPFLFSGLNEPVAPLADYLLLVLVTALITAGGYIINDYFDLKIDRINRPDQLVVNRHITNHTAIKLHLVINSIAVFLGFYLAWRIRSLNFGMIFPLVSGLLWIYSAKYKRTLFWGNFIVAALSSFVILIVWLFEFYRLRLDPEQFAAAIPDLRFTTVMVAGYAVFAFLMTMVREIIKDMEDMEGDKTAGCRTIPIVAGLPQTRRILAGILVLTIASLVYAQVMLYRFGFQSTMWYFLIAVQPGALFLLFRLPKSGTKRDFHFLSCVCKLVMVTGILSMVMLYLNSKSL